MVLGQEEVFQAVEDLGFTSLQELREELNSLTVTSISHSLKVLTKWQEIKTIQFGVRNIYVSPKTFEELTLENE